MRLGIIGSRNFTNFKLLNDTINNHFVKLSGDGTTEYIFDEIVSGGAKGADDLAFRFAKINGIDVKIFRPDWDKYGKAAGMIRNKDIIDNSDFVLAFWSGISPGTKNSLSLAKKLKKNTMIVYF